MSLGVCGILELNDAHMSLQEKVQLSFLIVEKATKYKIGINLGDAVFSGFLKRCDESSEKMPFELTDYPMDVNAEWLFAGKDIELRPIDPDDIDEIGETLLSRMTRVQNFLDELLKTKLINKIILNIDEIGVDSEDNVEVIEIKVNDFCRKMLELYEREENWTPTIRAIIKGK